MYFTLNFFTVSNASPTLLWLKSSSKSHIYIYIYFLFFSFLLPTIQKIVSENALFSSCLKFSLIKFSVSRKERRFLEKDGKRNWQMGILKTKNKRNKKKEKKRKRHGNLRQKPSEFLLFPFFHPFSDPSPPFLVHRGINTHAYIYVVV